MRLGHILQPQVVAEGVEDEQTLQLLGALGCDAAQGYAIARPMPAAEVERWLEEAPWAASTPDFVSIGAHEQGGRQD